MMPSSAAKETITNITCNTSPMNKGPSSVPSFVRCQAVSQSAIVSADETNQPSNNSLRQKRKQKKNDKQQHTDA